MKPSDRYEGPVPLKVCAHDSDEVILNSTFNILRLLRSEYPMRDLGPIFFNEPSRFVLTNLKFFLRCLFKPEYHDEHV